MIGVFNGQVKIIRNTPYNTSIAWDKGSSAGGTHGTYGWNDWSQATLKTELNTTFLNSIDATSKSYIDTNYMWNLGGWNTYNITRSEFYNKERGITVYSGRPTTWTGAIGLMYPSDYGYATNSTDNICNTSSIVSWNAGTAKTECASKSWLYNSSSTQWTLTPNSGVSTIAFVVDLYGSVTDADRVNITRSASPVLYLKSDVKVKSGNGTSSSPYVLGT